MTNTPERIIAFDNAKASLTAYVSSEDRQMVIASTPPSSRSGLMQSSRPSRSGLPPPRYRMPICQRDARHAQLQREGIVVHLIA